jgi:hypothetical protein
MSRALLLSCSLAVLACGSPAHVDAGTPYPITTVAPPPGTFNGTLDVVFTADREANVYVSLDGHDPRATTQGRVSGPSPFTVTLSATATLKYFSSVGGHDEPLQEGQWVRAGGTPGTISGVVVTGAFVNNQAVGVYRNTELKTLSTPTAPGEIPFVFEGLDGGTHRLLALADRNGDGQLTPFIDYQSNAATVTLDLSDPFKASAEGIRLYLGASQTGLGTIMGNIELPNAPPLQNLQVTALSPDALAAGFDPQALLQQLQGGYRIFTTPTQTTYPYVITDLKPGQYMPVPALMGLGAGGLALNLVARPLQAINLGPDMVVHQDFAFGPLTISGQVRVAAVSAPTGFGYGVVAARGGTLTDGMQAALMPVLFRSAADGTGDVLADYAGQAFREHTTFSLRVFSNANGAQPLTDALTWVVNPLSSTPGHATVVTSTTDVVQNIAVP